MTINIGHFLTKRAFLSPELEATVEPSAGGRRQTFRQLNTRCNQVANALRTAGVASGERVGLLMMNGLEFIETFYAVAKIGAVNVPLNWRLVADELEFILKDSGATTLVYSEEFAAVVAELQSRGTKTDIRFWVQVGGQPAAFATAYDAWRESAPDTEPELAGFEDDLLFIMYTSGTTGLPKGVMHSHNSVMWSMLTVAATADVRYGDRYLLSLPMFHVGALNPVMGNLYLGVTSVVLKSFDAKQSWELIRDEKITLTLMVPAMLQFMLATYDKATHDHSTLRSCFSGAAPVPVTLIEAYVAMGIEILQVYGLTESCGPGCLIVGDDAVKRAGSTGRAFFHTEMKVIDGHGQECPPGENGEVVLRGRHMMVGYWNRPDATAQTIRDGWLHTGDVGSVDEDGFLTIRDRMKDMLISGGENVYPAEVENVVLSHPAVTDVAVIGLPSPKWGEVPLVVAVKTDPNLTEAEVLEWCKGKLAPFKRPKVAVFIETIPRNPTGKILKRVLRDTYESSLKAPE
ncbi:MAG: long-chain-fatty-acid--CoA ligase [Xanthobacteraceae bacterium]|nr:long-chain-fatty-acid--CoA ligase [Xanthobacteraceae bacterium]